MPVGITEGAAAVDSDGLDELHRRAREGDDAAMNALILAFGRWVKSKARNPPPGIDPHDAESYAGHAIWLAARKCEDVYAITAWANSRFFYWMLDLRRRNARRITASVSPEWDRISACGVRFVSCPVARDRAMPCRDCGTTGGLVPKGQNRPRRTGGRCVACDALRKSRSAPPRPEKPVAPIQPCVTCGGLPSGSPKRINGQCRKCYDASRYRRDPEAFKAKADRWRRQAS
jgi:hypothetical protein